MIFRFALRVAVCLALGAATVAQAAPDHAAMINQARDQLVAERYVEALATAKDAVRANAKDYRGHYYVAMAYLGMGRFDDADEAAERARKLAPESARAGVDKLADTIKTRRLGTSSVQAAEAALADGLVGKAARLYDQAWSAGQNNPELALKAADLYANRLEQPQDAGRLLRQVVAKGGPQADKAAAELNKLTAALRKAALGHVAVARQQQGAEAMRSLQLAEDADPDYVEIHKLRAAIAAHGNDVAALQVAIKGLARRNLAKPTTLAGLPRMAQWLEQPAFAEFIGDMFGSAQVEKLRQLALNPTAEAGQAILDCVGCPEMVVVPAGSFDMGSPANEAGRYDDEGPSHRVGVKSFALGKTHITRGQFAAFVNASGHQTVNSCNQWTGSKWENLPGRDWRDPGFRQDDTHPAVCLSWNDAKAYAEWLAKKTGKPYRLPSEAELEYAIRAGATTARFWGDSPDQACGHANVVDQTTRVQVPGASGWALHNCSDGHAYTAPVGSFKPNGFGLHDMIGNAFQWAEDCWHENYAGAPADGSAWTEGDCVKRVQRGGSWYDIPKHARAAMRRWGGISYRGHHSGFRVARTLP